ncbi:putative reverse transcriptase domain-containing protein, partial [Tanacetum coccineum]
RDCRSPPNVNTGANQRACFECGAQGHFKKDCLKLKNNNNNRGNQAGHAKAQAKVYVVGNVGANPNNNVITGTFLLNNQYASILFDTGADRSFVSTAFSTRIIITPTALDHDYNVELADGRIVGLNTIIQGCTLNLLKKCYSDDPLVVPLEGFQVDDKLHFVEEPIEIMDREVKQLRRSRVPIVKVRWNSRRGLEF